MTCTSRVAAGAVIYTQPAYLTLITLPNLLSIILPR